MMNEQAEPQAVFRHSLPVQIRFNDVDRYGHVNNNAYFAYYDNAGSSILATRYGLLAVSLLGLLAAVLIVVQSLRLLTSARRTLHAAARPVPIASDSRRFRHAPRRVRL